jgi:hypothetical protein
VQSVLIIAADDQMFVEQVRDGLARPLGNQVLQTDN